jgi:hypothetical protein
MKLGHHVFVVLSSVFFFASGAQAASVTIDFESDARGAIVNGFTSSDSALVSFSDTRGADLRILDGGPQTNGNAIGALFDDISELQMDFTLNITSLSFSFGNDDARLMPVGGRAVLCGFLDGAFVGQESVVANRNDNMDQSISFTGLIDQAVFYYADARGAAVPLVELVDDITFETALPAVPVPASGVMLLGALAFLARRKRSD